MTTAQTPNAFTILLTVPGSAEGGLLTAITATGQPCIRIYSGIPTNTDAAASLAVDIYTDARDQPLVLAAPWHALGDAAHTVLLRYRSHLAELYIDGVLVDEEWPIGAVLPDPSSMTSIAPAEFADHAWNDAEMAERFGDAEQIRQQELVYFGAEPQLQQYWKPRGFNTHVGDCMPYWDGENLHIYYLFDRRGHRSKWGLGAHQWAHMSTADLQQWQQHPLAVGITEQWEGSICTGSVIRKDQQYYAFYAVRANDGSPARLTWAISQDGVRYAKSGQYIPLSDRYTLPSVRDPHVFEDEQGRYHMMITTSLIDGVHKQGCLAHLVSEDLQQWEEVEPLLVPGYHDEPECSDYFQWNDWYYLIFSNDGLARYRYSRSPMGPWLRPAMDVLDGVQLRVPKTAAYHDGRRIAAGFLSAPNQYGGELVLRELLQQADGTLGLSFPKELIGSIGSIADNRPQQSAQYRFGHSEGFSQHIWGAGDLPYMLTFEMETADPNMFVGFSVADTEQFTNGYDIRFEPSNNKLGVHKIDGISFLQNETSSIYHVHNLEQRITVQAIVRPDLIDICCNNERTLIARLNGRHRYLRFFTHFGTAAFSQVSIRPWGRQ